MASKKQKKKQIAGERKRRGVSPMARHPDGDRRRRGGMTVKQAQADKQARREFLGIPIDVNETDEKR